MVSFKDEDVSVVFYIIPVEFYHCYCIIKYRKVIVFRIITNDRRHIHDGENPALYISSIGQRLPGPPCPRQKRHGDLRPGGQRQQNPHRLLGRQHPPAGVLRWDVSVFEGSWDCGNIKELTYGKRTRQIAAVVSNCGAVGN